MVSFTFNEIEMIKLINLEQLVEDHYLFIGNVNDRIRLFLLLLKKLLSEICFVRFIEQVGENRSTVWYSKLEHFDFVSFVQNITLYGELELLLFTKQDLSLFQSKICVSKLSSVSWISVELILVVFIKFCNAIVRGEGIQVTVHDKLKKTARQ